MWLTPYRRRNEIAKFHSLFDELTRDLSVENVRAFSPNLDIQENEKEIHVQLEVPGVDKKDVQIAVKDHLLTIKGEKKHESEEKKEGYTWKERSYGSFQRSIRLPEGTDNENVSARLENGVLEVTLPKKTEAQPKSIVIN